MRSACELSAAIAAKKAQIADARAWVQDLKDLRDGGHDLTHADKFNSANYVVLLQDDLRKLEQEQTS